MGEKQKMSLTAFCIQCGDPVSYWTDKPIRCPACQAAHKRDIERERYLANREAKCKAAKARYHKNKVLKRKLVRNEEKGGILSIVLL